LRFFGRLFIIPISLSLIGRIRGLLFFSGVIDRTLRSVSRSSHVRSTSSPIRIPVSFRVCITVESIFPVLAMSRSISCSVGMNGSCVVAMYFGGVHVIWRYLR